MTKVASVVLLFSLALSQTSCRLVWGESLMPLFLTPFLESGQIQKAQNLSRVYGLSEDGDDVESYAGYFTVNKTYSSNMFFWFFPAETDPAKAPVLLWLNGGPGRTSLVGALLENGPYRLTKASTVKRTPIAWTQAFSMLYLDNPMNVGYSFTLDDAGMSTNTDETAVNLYSALVQFFKLFPQYSRNDFYIGGQSYAGKYIPVLGCYIHDRNTDTKRPPEIRINFKGIYVGAGFCDPEHMMPAYPDFLYNFGIILEAERAELRSEFTKVFQDSLDGNIRNTVHLHNFFGHGLPSGDHLLGPEHTNSELMMYLWDFMDSWNTRTKLHVGFSAIKFNVYSVEVMNALTDFLSSTSRHNAFLMDNYKVLHFSGNLDVVVNVPIMEAFLTNVSWVGQAEYRKADRRQWKLDDDLMGWVVTIRNFTRVVIRNCGHMVPYDQPKAALEMMKRFVFDQPFETVDLPPCTPNSCYEELDVDDFTPDYEDDWPDLAKFEI